MHVEDKLARQKRGMRFAQKRAERRWGWLFIAPTMIGLIVLNIIPIFQTIYKTFFKTGDFGKGNIFIGLDNYARLFGDKDAWQALGNTLLYTLMEVPFSIAIALVLAVFLNRKLKGRGIYRAIYFVPMVVAPAAVAMVWRWLYNKDFGLLNMLLGKLGLGPVSWLSDPRFALGSVAFVGIWSVIGYNLVLFLAGLQEIPYDYYEAAEIDGASGVRQFFNITIPLLSPQIYFVLTTRIIAGLQVFDLIFMMIQKSNPVLPRVQSLVYLFYKYTFEQYNQGYGSTIVLMLLVVTMIITGLQQLIQKKWVYYN